MRLRVLGCHGGESPSHRTSCFAIDEKLLLDAGSVTRSLSLIEQSNIDYIYLSHSHIDHVKGLPLLLDNVIANRNKPVTMIATAGTEAALSQHLFNGLLWPDFSKIPTCENPILRIRIITPREIFTLDGGFELLAIPVHHSIECHGIIVNTKSGAIAYTGDTGPTDEFWQVASSHPKLRAVICEVSFTNEMEKLAGLSGHLTPKMLANELTKFKPQNNTPIFITHMKPGLDDSLKAQLAELNDARIKILHLLDEINI
ncbi:MAG: 3',5'-cyclic-nucleotide phosphodiesterase [Deltaproteobacteria bacterium]|nr:3',5'-cyclic-nucleotide phosphodiesterase [Deltaproteobacteria bacterium]